MLETLNIILSVRADTTYLVAALTFASALVFFQMTGSRTLTLLFTPLAAIGALVGIYVSREMGYYYSSDEDSNIIMSGLLGLLVSLIIVILTARLTYLLLGMLRRWQASRLRTTRADVRLQHKSSNSAPKPLQNPSKT